MRYQGVVACIVLFSILASATAMAQSESRYRDTYARVLDLLFPLDVAPDSYQTELALRFGDSDTQFVLLIYPVYPVHPGGRAEVVRYSLASKNDGELSQLISKMTSENPNVKDQEIAAKVKVNISRSPIDYEALNRSLKELRSIRISPLLSSRIAVDAYSDYEYWYDSGQESVHYTITGPFKSDPQDKLVQWMIRFRENLPNLLRAPSKP